MVWVAMAVTTIGQAPVEPGDIHTPAAHADRFLARPPETLTQYRATRRLEARNGRFRKHGWVEVSTELTADGFSFQVIEEGGSGYIRDKVLRPILQGERDLVARGDVARSALSWANYDFTAETPAEPGVVRLTVTPRRKDITLIDGSVFVTETDADLVRIEGRLAKSPSFWTRRVEVVRRYGRIAGVRVPLSIESIAHVRIAGRSEMTMTYRYQMVNGRLVHGEETPGTTESSHSEVP
jgi:hypothetical protein